MACGSCPDLCIGARVRLRMPARAGKKPSSSKLFAAKPGSRTLR
ncbi:hypothetical protein [Lysobacter gummosus]